MYYLYSKISNINLWHHTREFSKYWRNKNRSYLAQKPDKIGQEHRIIVHQSQNNIPFIKNNSSGIQTIDLQFIFKNEDNGGRITHVYTTNERLNIICISLEITFQLTPYPNATQYTACPV